MKMILLRRVRKRIRCLSTVSKIIKKTRYLFLSCPYTSQLAVECKPRAAVVHFNFRARSTVPVCTVPNGHWFNKADNQQG